MARTMKELRELIKDIPDEAEVWAYEGEICGIMFSMNNLYLIHTLIHAEGGKAAFLDNTNKEEDKEWKGND